MIMMSDDVNGEFVNLFLFTEVVYIGMGVAKNSTR